MFNANQRVKDSHGRAIVPGRYSVARGGDVRHGTVTEDEATDLWITFDGQERPQRVDELSQFCTWERVEPTEAQTA